MERGTAPFDTGHSSIPAPASCRPWLLSSSERKLENKPATANMSLLFGVGQATVRGWKGGADNGTMGFEAWDVDLESRKGYSEHVGEGEADLGIDLYWGVGLGLWVDLELGSNLGVDLGLEHGFESEKGGFGTRGCRF